MDMSKKKSMETRLRRLKQMNSRLSQEKSVGGKGKLTGRMIDQITTYYGNAIIQNDTESCFGCILPSSFKRRKPLHSFCPVGLNSWCKYSSRLLESCLKTFKHNNKLPMAVMGPVKLMFNDLSEPKVLHKCLGGKTQNNN
ncbi:uncharacterized protein TNCV_1235941 [Trichonephila clavipes]|nr:uncharacterized protein TNCV_1235941 [Trichonephila clavipes]